MNQMSYMLKQAWLAHTEMGLGPLVQLELWIVAILVACRLVERVVRPAVRTSPVATATCCSEMEGVSIRNRPAGPLHTPCF